MISKKLVIEISESCGNFFLYLKMCLMFLSVCSSRRNGWGLWASSLPSHLEMSMGLALGSGTDIEYIEI